jgi:hypothetical protein
VVSARYLVGLAFAGIAALGLTRAEPSSSHPDSTDVSGYRLPKDAHFVGSLSCASAACHAASGNRPGSEYTTWAGGDPHSDAYRVLSEPRSRRMVELLHGTKPGKPTPAHHDTRCLACHSPESAVREPTRGVGCESCHGPAKRWLTAHYQDDFKRLTARDKAERYGLYPMKNLAFRITLCASCHVGEPGREVDHDLIAAGHPRLAFEYTGYHHNPKYHRHWREMGYGPEFDARAWEIGQVACALAAAKLIEAHGSDGKHVWPELADFSCFACHQDTAGNKWALRKKPGALPLNRWYFEMLDAAGPLLEVRPDRERTAAAAHRLADELEPRLRDLQNAAEKYSRTRPDSSKQLAIRFRTAIDHALTPDGRRFRAPDWDGVAQHYLAAAAIYYAWGSVDPAGRDERLRPPLVELDRLLTFRKGYNSPADADPARLLEMFRRLRSDSPRDPHQ